MKLSEASLKLSVPRYHLNYWKKTGLIGNETGRLEFSDLVKVRFIQNCKKNRISLKQIRKMMHQLEERQSESREKWTERLHVYFPGLLLARTPDGDGIIHPETGQLFLNYEPKGESRVLSIEKGGEGDSVVQALEAAYLSAIENGGGKEPKTILKQLLKLQPDHKSALIEMGNMAFEDGDFDRSTLFYERALKVDPFCVEALYNLANIYFKQKKFAAAIRNFHRCIACDPDFPESYYNLGLVYYSLEMFDRARFFLESYLEIDPDSSWSDQARFFIGHIEQFIDETDNRLF